MVEEDPDSHEHADFAAPEVDANGAHYTDEAKSLEVGRQGVLPSLVHHSWGAWTEDDLTGLQLRGAGYLQDHVKIGCGPPLFRLAHIDIFHTLKEEDKVLHIAQRDNQWVKVMASKRKKALEKVRRRQRSSSSSRQQTAGSRLPQPWLTLTSLCRLSRAPPLLTLSAVAATVCVTAGAIIPSTRPSSSTSSSPSRTSTCTSCSTTSAECRRLTC